MESLFKYQDLVLRALKERAEPFYLAGGTALAKFYFQHRDSFDLDFFTQEYSSEKVRNLIRLIEKETKKRTRLISQNTKEGFAKISIHELLLEKDQALKIDFVEDVSPLIRPLKRVDGVDVLSLDDIYFRKIKAAGGTMPDIDEAGRKRFLGGRETAKDFYDLYQLSSTYKRLSRFAIEHCDDWQREALIRWYHTYNRQEMKIGLTELRTRGPVEFVTLERHFKQEIDELIGGIL